MAGSNTPVLCDVLAIVACGVVGSFIGMGANLNERNAHTDVGRRCAVGEVRGGGIGVDNESCLPHYPWPDELNYEITESGSLAMKDHMRWCGAWIREDGVHRRRSVQYWSFHRTDVDICYANVDGRFCSVHMPLCARPTLELPLCHH